MRERIRSVLRQHAQLSQSIEELSDDADLYRAGLTSHATVNVMLALEDEFELEFPESLLLRRTFASIRAIEEALSSVPSSSPRRVIMTPSLAERTASVAGPRAPGGLDVWGWEARVAAVATCAGEHATRVDADARFPAESVEAMRAAGLLGAWVDPSLGGLGVSIAQVAWACEEIGQRCASSAMVFAMHQIEVASLVRHAGTSDWWTTRLREIAARSGSSPPRPARWASAETCARASARYSWMERSARSRSTRR